MVIKRWLHLQPLCLCSKKERQRAIWAQKACQPVLSPDPVTWPGPAWGNWGSKYWCREYHHSKQQRSSVSEEEGGCACWTDNSGSGSTLQREAASRQLSRRSSRFLQMQIRAVTLLVTSLGTTNPGIKLTGDLHVVCRTKLCAMSDTKDSLKKWLCNSLPKAWAWIQKTRVQVPPLPCATHLP